MSNRLKVSGLVTVRNVKLADGTSLSTQRAVEYGWIRPVTGRQPSGWGLERHEVSLGENLFVDNGRQLLAYCFAFRSPIENYTCHKFGVGTGVTAARVTDVALEAPITLSGGYVTQDIDMIDFLSAFVVRVSYTLGLADANGYLISEQGLFSGNDTLIARKVDTVGIAKTSDASYNLAWRLRF